MVGVLLKGERRGRAVALLGCYAPLIGSYLPTFRDSLMVHLQGSSSPRNGTNRLSRNVGNYQSTLRNIPAEQIPHLYRGGSLKSRHHVSFGLVTKGKGKGIPIQALRAQGG
jgi:hypothetical protein